MIRRSTLLCCMLVMIAGTIVFVGSAIFSDDKAANRAVELVQEEDQQVGKEAYLYELKDVSYDGKEVTGTWTDEMGDRQVLRAVLPSAEPESSVMDVPSHCVRTAHLWMES